MEAINRTKEGLWDQYKKQYQSLHEQHINLFSKADNYQKI
jgi:hypothetical protein